MVDNTPYWKLHDKHDESLWEDVQKKTFCGWVNMHLAKKDMRVSNLEKDFSDGVRLIALLEVLNGEKIEGRYYKNPKSKPYMIDNVHFALNIITDVFGVKLIHCSPEDIVDGNIKIILGMLWRLINRFQLPADNSRTWLLNWCSEVTASYEGVEITNFHTCFQDGLAFCALLHYYDSDFLDFSSLTKEDGVKNLRLAFHIAEEHLEIPQLLDASDIFKGLTDERSVMTYVSMIRRAYEQKDHGGLFKVTPSLSEVKERVAADETESEEARLLDLQKMNCQLNQEVLTLKETVDTLTRENEVLKDANRTLKAQIESELAESSEETEASLRDTPRGNDSAVEEEDKKTAPVEPARESKKQTPIVQQEQETRDTKEATAPVPQPAEVPPQKEEPKPEPKPESKPVKMEEPETKEAHKEEKRKASPADQAEPETEKKEPAKSKEAPQESAAAPEDGVPKAKLDKKIKKQSRIIYQLQNANAELTKEIDETREKLLQQVKVSETLQKSLEDTREEIGLIQKQQKKSQDKNFKKIQRRAEKKVQRREKEIETLKTNHESEIQKKESEIQILRRQLKKIQEALGGSVAPQSAIIEADVQALQAEKDDLLAMVKLFEEEEVLMAARAQKEREEAEEFALDY